MSQLVTPSPLAPAHSRDMTTLFLRWFLQPARAFLGEHVGGGGATQRAPRSRRWTLCKGPGLLGL